MRGEVLIIYLSYAFTLIALLGSSCGSKGIDEVKVPVPKADFLFSIDVADKCTINFTNVSKEYSFICAGFWCLKAYASVIANRNER